MPTIEVPVVSSLVRVCWSARETGARRIGDIAALAELVVPDVAVVSTSTGRDVTHPRPVLTFGRADHADGRLADLVLDRLGRPSFTSSAGPAAELRRNGAPVRCDAQPMRSASETMIPSGPRT